LTRVLETALYVADLNRAAAFYGDVLGLPCIHEDYRMRAYDVGGNGVLLLFPQGGSLQPIETPGGSIPPHDGHGLMHVAFSIARDELEEWQRHLTDAGVALEGANGMAQRWRERLLPRSRQSPAGDRHTWIVEGVLGREWPPFMFSPEQPSSSGTAFTDPLAILHRLKVHSINHPVATSFRCSDSSCDVFQRASARSQEADPGQRRSNPNHQNEGISPDKPG
jgi:catechol 2,3-dioxygenase-like lactoylglutathione lyase family enzyme